MGEKHPYRKARRPGIWLLPSFFLLGLFIVWLWWRLFSPSREPNVSRLPKPIPAAALRNAGEKATALYPGLESMGKKDPAKGAFKPWDKSAVSSSCRGSGLKDGRSSHVVLVTGAAGSLGSHAALALRHRGHGLVGIDNFNDYYAPSLKRARQAWLQTEDVHVVDGDVNDRKLLQKLFDACHFTHVLYLSTQAGVRYASSNYQSYSHSNVAGLVSVLEVAKAQAVMPAIIYGSSSNVYGLNSKAPGVESDLVNRPASLAAASMRAGELMAHAYHAAHGLSVTGLRFAAVYGPWGRPDSAPFKFAVSMMKGQAIPIYHAEDGSELARDFTYMDDAVEAVMAAIEAAGSSIRNQATYRLYNIGNIEPHTVSALLNLLEQHLSHKAIRQTVPLGPTKDVLASATDISAAHKDLGYTPQVTLEAGIKNFSSWFYDYYGDGRVDTAKLAADWGYQGFQLD